MSSSHRRSSNYDSSRKRDRLKDSYDDEQDEIYDSLTTKKQKHGNLKPQDSSEEESDDEDDSEGEWVIKMDSGNYNSSSKSASAESAIKEPSVTSKIIDMSELNKLKSNVLRAKLKGASKEEIEKLEKEYEDAAAGSSVSQKSSSSDTLKVLDSEELRAYHELNKHTKGKTLSADASITDMMREELAERNAPVLSSAKRIEELKRIGKDSGFENDTDYQFDNAELLTDPSGADSKTKLTEKQKQKESLRQQEVAKKINTRVLEHTKLLNDITSRRCFLCPESERHEKYLNPPINDQSSHSRRHSHVNKIISASPRVYMARAPLPALSRGTCVLVPRAHYPNLLHCDEDEWEELRNYMKCLIRMWVHGRGYAGVAFYENAVSAGLSAHEDANASQGARDSAHAMLYAVPIKDPYDFKDLRAMFREAMITSDEEWSTHRKVIDTQAVATRATESGNGSGAKYAFRQSISKEAPYFHVWFDINGGLGHIVEDRGKWPRGDLFAREILGNILKTDITKIRRTPRWDNSENEKDIWDYQSTWDKYDWTKDLE
ncbi:uncharacterized protein SAPINGB_P002588 [Magnusiomyces paraingens]|uniref:Cwf19-like C-terminal domain-containing protein n=1 Tax=Magnusiomyces paraingens TaxID=2606893 RepID=A0A5E8BEP9_9ASCO|nr:uncharacterized protein SAPINGB_P002588 [Saprochaete ingens]VVT50075.1 unnamed protein product [Saprochaete ingens]